MRTHGAGVFIIRHTTMNTFAFRGPSSLLLGMFKFDYNSKLREYSTIFESSFMDLNIEPIKSYSIFY